MKHMRTFFFVKHGVPHPFFMTEPFWSFFCFPIFGKDMDTQEYVSVIIKIMGQAGIKKWEPSRVLATVGGVTVGDT